MNYCPECTSRLQVKFIDGVERKACTSTQCTFVHWDNPIPVVIVLVEFKEKIILARNARWPKDMFSFVAGYLERNETPEEAVVREVKEELGLDGNIPKFIGFYSFAAKNQIMLAHSIVAEGELRLGEEISEVKLLTRDELACWPFGVLTLTSEIADHWLNKTTPKDRVTC